MGGQLSKTRVAISCTNQMSKQNCHTPIPQKHQLKIALCSDILMLACYGLATTKCTKARHCVKTESKAKIAPD